MTPGSGIAGAGAGDVTRVLVIVGTDHHPFDRLIEWVNDWLRQHPEQVGYFFVQWGAASVRPACPGAQFLTFEQLNDLLKGAVEIICHGGGGSISDAWTRGMAPIVVPRLRRLGEHVDDHQVHFSGKLAELGRIRLAQTREEFASLLEASATSPDHGADHQAAPVGSVDAEILEAVARFGALVDELVSRPPRRRRPHHRARPAPAADVAAQAAVSGPHSAQFTETPTTWGAGRPAVRVGPAGEPEKEQG